MGLVPSDILGAVNEGIDMFDCVMPTRSARSGLAFTWKGKLNLKTLNLEMTTPSDNKCDIESNNIRKVIFIILLNLMNY